jgi:glycosyltransferase involved in cell wall biosynthesis
MKSRLRILHIGNGRAFKIKAIANAFVERGHDVHMVPVPVVDDAWPGVDWHQLPEPAAPGPLKVIARMRQLRKLARALKPDIVHAHNAWGPGWYGASVGSHPFLIHAYGGDLLPEQYSGRPAAQRRLTAWSCRRADRIIVTGRHMIDAAAKGLGIPRDRLLLLPRGVDLTRYRPGLDTAALRARLGLAAAAPVILSPRYQVDEALYNLDVVIDAFVSVREHFPGAVCIQLYDPAREAGRARLEALAAARGVGRAYVLAPAVSNSEMPLFYNLADVVVSVPSSDGFPVTVLEASACGAAMVVSDLSYCAEWFQSGSNGLVVPPRDSRALAGAVSDLCGHPEVRRQFGCASRRLVEARADYRRCMDRLESVYQDLLASGTTQLKDA